MEPAFQGKGNMSRVQKHAHQTVVHADEDGWHEPESLQKVLKGRAVQSRSGLTKNNEK